MTNRSRRWTRRQFSQALAATAASTLLVSRASASNAATHDGFAFVGSSAVEPLHGTIRVYRVSGEVWREVHAVAAASPAHLVMHPTKPVLYVVHDVAMWDHRPRGAVSAFRFNTATGHLTHFGTQPLSLSATHPRCAVVSSNGGALFVSAETGGIYNLLPITADGNLQPVSGIRKEFGLQEGHSAKAAAPRQLVLHADGSVYATDPGQETITRFIAEHGAIVLQHRSRVHAGFGASHLAFSRSGHAYAMSADGGSVSMHNATSEGLSPAMQTWAGAGFNASMRMHPDGHSLAISSEHTLQILRVHPLSGRLTSLVDVRQRHLQQLQFAAGGMQLAGILPASGEVVVYSFDPRTGVNSPRVVSQAAGAGSLLLRLA